MVQASLQFPTLSLQVPCELALQVTSEQFSVLVAANRELRLERTANGELIVNPPTGGKTGQRNWSIAAQSASGEDGGVCSEWGKAGLVD